jgi:uncharacterized protein YcaQ
LSIHTLLAHFTGAEMLKKGVSWATSDITDALEKPASPNETPLVRNTVVTIATQYILFAAEVLAKHVEADKWWDWAFKLQHLAETSTEGTEWNLKQHARKAFEKLVEVRPELFGE